MEAEQSIVVDPEKGPGEHQLAARPDPIRRRMRPMLAWLPLREQRDRRGIFASFRSSWPRDIRSLSQLGIEPDRSDCILPNSDRSWPS
jgi:hypothetical protein